MRWSGWWSICGNTFRASIPRTGQMWRHFRTAISSLCLVMCLGFMAFWLQSYVSLGVLNGRIFGPDTFYATSWEGRLRVGAIALIDEKTSIDWSKLPPLGSGWGRLPPFRSRWSFIPKESAYLPPQIYQERSFLGFYVEIRRLAWFVSAPHWFLVLVTGTLAVLMKPKPRLKFSLLGLLMLTTFVALVLGAVEALARFSV